MRILYAISGHYGGTTAGESRVQKFSRGLKELGCEVRIVALSGTSSMGPDGWAVDSCGIPFTYVSRLFRGRLDAWRLFFQARRRLLDGVRRVVGECSIDAVVLYGNSWYMAAPIIPFCRRHGVRCAIDLNEWFPLRATLSPLFWDQQLLVRRVFPGVSGLIGISRLWEEHARRRGVPVIRIPAVGEDEPLPARPARRDAAAPFTLLHTGTVSSRGLPMTLLEGVRRASTSGTLVRLVVAGGAGQYAAGREAMQKARTDPVLKDCVTFTGWLSPEAFREQLAQADATVLLRDETWENRACFPTRLSEYLLTARPAILSGAGDLPLYFRHRENAWLLPPGDRPAELAEAIGRLAAHPDEAARIGEAGCRTALEEFSFRRHAGRLLEFLKELER